jgi:signal transduction histidine kinase
MTSNGESSMSTPLQKRILVIDDNPAIHADFAKILCPQVETNQGLQDAKAAFFGKAKAKAVEAPYQIDAASQGKEALELVKKARADGQPYALAFVDVRMPPGWDGVETIARMWEADADLQCVICTAYADYSWDEMIAKLGRNDRLLILKKPFDPIEVCQIAIAMTEKWCSTRRERAQLEEVKRAEQEARAYAASLVTTNRALESSRARAEAALQSKSESLANMSQGIRAPLLAILGHAELLGNDRIQDGQRVEHANTIHQHGESVLSSLSDLFDLACIETQRLALTHVPIDPKSLASEVIASLAERAQAKSLELSCTCAADVPANLHSDPARLEQVLRHLIENAIEFTPHGSVRVAIAYDQPADADPKLRFTITDTGPGIAAELHGRLFEAFTSADSSPERTHGGAGLGLVLSKRLAQLMGGDITVESQAGRGSEFTFTVRAHTSAPAANDPHPRAPIPSTVAAKDADTDALAGRKILLVDDVHTTQKLFRHFLEAAGAHVETADDGRAAVELALGAESGGEPFDTILMDIQMPVMDGYAAVQELRQRGFTKPIIAVTANSMTGDREKCLAAGCDDYASKPLARKSLIELCCSWPRTTEPQTSGEAHRTAQ